jgi:hypothetical protein
MPIPFSGGCACSAIRYTCTAEPLFSLNCHCRDCQRESGGAYVPVLGVPKAGFAVLQGEPRYFAVTADSGFTTTRVFCADCGSTLFGLPGSALDVVTLRVGSLDDPSGFRPDRDIYTASAQPWDRMDPDLPKFAKLPDAGAA